MIGIHVAAEADGMPVNVQQASSPPSLTPPSSPLSASDWPSPGIEELELDAPAVDQVREQLLEIYESSTADSRGVMLVDELLQNWRGREHELLRVVQQKHANHTECCRRYYQHEVAAIFAEQDPARLGSLDKLLAEWRGKERLLLETVRAKYNVEAVDRWAQFSNDSISRIYPVWVRPLPPRKLHQLAAGRIMETTLAGALAIIAASPFVGGCIWAMASPDVQAAYARLALSMLSHRRLSSASPCTGEVWLLQDIAAFATSLGWSAMRRAVQLLGDRDAALPRGTRVQVDGYGYGDYVGEWVVKRNRDHASHIVRFDSINRDIVLPLTLMQWRVVSSEPEPREFCNAAFGLRDNGSECCLQLAALLPYLVTLHLRRESRQAAANLRDGAQKSEATPVSINAQAPISHVYPKLTELKLTGNNIGAETFTKTLAVVLPHCVHLKELWLGQNDLGNEGVRTLTTVLPPNLHLLDVSQNGIGYTGWITLLDAISLYMNDQLETLLFGRNSCGDDGAAAFASRLTAGKYSALQAVDITNNGIGDSGVNVLAGALRRRPLASLAVGGARSVAWAAGTGVHFTSDRISKRGRRYVGERAAPYGLRVMHAV